MQAVQEALISCFFPAPLPSEQTLAFARPSISAEWLLRKVRVTHRCVSVKGNGSVPFEKESLDLKDTANLWSI